MGQELEPPSTDPDATADGPGPPRRADRNGVITAYIHVILLMQSSIRSPTSVMSLRTPSFMRVCCKNGCYHRRRPSKVAETAQASGGLHHIDLISRLTKLGCARAYLHAGSHATVHSSSVAWIAGLKRSRLRISGKPQKRGKYGVGFPTMHGD